MIVEPCTCDPVPVRSSLESKPGATLVDAIDDKGRWHAVKVGEIVYLQSLVEPVAPPRRAAEVVHDQAEAQDARALEHDPDATDGQRAWAAAVLNRERALARARRTNNPKETRP